ncbi:MAG: hypothetical protein CMJ49_10355 [Planctomycetaceae bacterium]|nr:hypothetical protein [Planctomycetaceae bacterium]
MWPRAGAMWTAGLLACLWCVSSTSAAVIDFESAPPGTPAGNGCASHGLTMTTQGFVFTAVSPGSNGLLTCDGTDPNIGSNGTHTLLDNNSAPDFDFQATSGLAFDLISLDVGELLASIPARNATQIGVGGFPFGGGSPLVAVFNLDGIVDGPGGSADLQTFTLPTTFTNLAKAKVTFTLGGIQSAEFLVDNINVRTIPLPSGMMLGASALFGVGLMRRRHRA